jgi:hypothetical protein
MQRIKRAIVNVIVVIGAGLAAAPAHAQEGRTLNSTMPGGERGAGSAAGAEGNFYVPGMPVPKPQPAAGDAAAAGGAAAQGGGSGRVSKISVVDRSPSHAQDATPPASWELYRGIIPGSRDSHARTDRDRAKAERKHQTQNSLYWLGFQPATAERGTVVFVQTLLPGAAYRVEVLEGGAQVELIIPNAGVKRRNDLRLLDTHFWPGQVTGVQAQRRGRDVAVVITLSSPTPHAVEQKEDFIFIRFQDPDASGVSSAPL